MANPKFKIGVEVILTSMYPNHSPSFFEGRGLFVGSKYTICSLASSDFPVNWRPSGVEYVLAGIDSHVDESMLTFASDYYKLQEKSQMEYCLNNTKIDVQEYATRYGITLEQAHNEIQTFLFEQGYVWSGIHCAEYLETKDQYVFLYEDKYITHSWEEDHFYHHRNKQILIDRNVIISLTIRKEVATIEIEGKKYTKEDVMKAIQQFEIV